MDSVSLAVQLTVLLLFVAGLVWVAIELAFRDPHGAAAMLRDSEAFARAAAPDRVPPGALGAAAPAHVRGAIPVLVSVRR